MKIRKIIFVFSIILILLSIKYNINDNYLINNKELFTSNPKVLEKYGYIDGYGCKKITVLDKDGKYQGKYDLEDYVARVVSGETHILDDEVTFEAMSVAIRTYALYVTKNCKYPIINSEANQVMSDTVSSKIRNAVKKTKGQVLVLNNKLVKSEYDSFYMGEGFYCDRKYCYSTYQKVGNNTIENIKTHKVKVPASWAGNLSGGHGKGLSQYGALYMSEQNYTYDKILKYFYADGTEIGTTIKPNVDGLYMNNGFVSRISRPLRNNSFYYKNDKAPINALEGENTWYATSRANEILKSINSKKRISYFDNANKYCNIVDFNKSYDYTKPKLGAIISWGDHLAIIENIENNRVDITEAYPAIGYYGVEYSYEYLNKNGKFYNPNTNDLDRKYNCEKNETGCFKRTNNIKISDLKNRWGYEFKCYVYLKD